MKKLSTEYLAECRNALNAEQTRSLATTDNWSHVDKQQAHLDWDVLYKELTPLLERSPSSPEVQALMTRHYAVASRFYAPSKQAYIGLGLFYQENQDMKNFHNAYHPNMVDFLGEAMCVYAQGHLSA
ncbi:TipAS antibiotic-recognition domain-containing protein [Rhizobacter sp. Root1221]|uniref:TipAS antibiotic-recognition domain-containing protein n=1 Tax=Rhizobacter sp. Root1221 TaxID=1736433 RepID=UPI0006F74B06|nr:TipAS antibiotic-recognition domain-containing protein [Rhizobacter sp. Root1221]KQV81137.1 transcriptional regulator [Rhizobacter sp. Root1221]